MIRQAYDQSFKANLTPNSLQVMCSGTKSLTLLMTDLSQYAIVYFFGLRCEEWPFGFLDFFFFRLDGFLHDAMMVNLESYTQS